MPGEGEYGVYGVYAYAAGKISDFLSEHGLQHRPRSSSIGCGPFEHGICVSFPLPARADDEVCLSAEPRNFIAMSIQTHPSISGWAFAETAMLLSAKKIISPACLGYEDDVIRHREPEDLFHHLEQVKTLLSDKHVFDMILAQNDHQSTKMAAHTLQTPTTAEGCASKQA